MNKSNFLILLFILSAFLSLAFVMKPAEDVQKPKMANVSNEDGIYLFLMCDPVDKYETLGEVEGPVLVWDHKFPTTLKYMTKRTKKQYPNADGAIMLSQYKWKAIKFK